MALTVRMKISNIQFIFMALAAPLLAGCEKEMQPGEADGTRPCTYRFESIANLSIGGVDLSQEPTLSDYGRILDLLFIKMEPFPMIFDLNLAVLNPNTSEAQLAALDYVLFIDGVEFASGSALPYLTVESTGDHDGYDTEGTKLGLHIESDIAGLLYGASGNESLRAVKRFAGMTSDRAEVDLRIRPSVKIADYSVPEKDISVEFRFSR